MTTFSRIENPQLTVPGVAEDYVPAEFVRVVGVHIQQAKDYLSGVADGVPRGIVQRQNAHLPYAENERDFYVEQFSEAFGAGTYGFDETMTRYEREATENPGALVQRPDSGPDTVTLKLGAKVKECLGLATDQDVIVEGCTYRRVVFGMGGTLAPGDRALILEEYEIPVAHKTIAGRDMARVVLFAPARVE